MELTGFALRAFQKGCQGAGYAIEWRPRGEPRFGGHIERLIGTQMGRLHLLPRTAFSNERELGDYNSKRHVALTLREIERTSRLISSAPIIGRSINDAFYRLRNGMEKSKVAANARTVLVRRLHALFIQPHGKGL